MITPILERLLLRGDANFAVHNFAFSSFGRIPCPNGKIAVITKIIWNHFINPYDVTGSWIDYLKFTEWQLKIDGKANVSAYTFRNNFSVMIGGNGWNWDKNVAAADLGTALIQPGPPIMVDTFIICTDFIKLSLTRDIFINSFGETVAPPSQRANMAPGPNGIGNLSVMEKLVMSSPGGAQQTYNPPGNEYSGIPPVGPRNLENYSQDVAPESGLHSPNAMALYIQYPYLTQPLVTFHVVYINEEAAHNIQSTT